MKIGSKISAARKAAGLTQTALADKCGYEHQSRISGYETDKREPDLEDIEIMAKAMGLRSAQDLIGYGDSIGGHGHGNVSGPMEIKGWIPLISYVEAGRWSETVDIYEPGYAEKVVPTAVNHSIHTFALRVEGHSMTLPAEIPGRSFPEGMIIYVDPMQECVIGDFVVARLSGTQDATFKKLGQEEGRPILIPLNPNRTEYPIYRSEFEIIGRVIDASWGGL